jgi:hypothetical protein
LIAIEQFHPMISSNILPNILPKKIYIAFERKIAKKKTLLVSHTHSGEVTHNQYTKKVILMCYFEYCALICLPCHII